jgi:hypothetical protein
MDLWNSILQLPSRCLLNKKITKAFFKRNFDLTVAEKTLLDKQIATTELFGSLNPENTNINLYSADDISYNEIVIVIANIANGNFETDHIRVAELIHKHIPYAILLCVFNDEQMVWSTFEKRINQKDINKRIIAQRHFTAIIPIHDRTALQQYFLNSLAFSGLRKTNLHELYNSYTERIFALQASYLNSTFTVRTKSRTQHDMLLLDKIAKLQQEIENLSNTAKKETQLNKQVYLNLQVQNKRSEMAQLKLQIVSE